MIDDKLQALLTEVLEEMYRLQHHQIMYCNDHSCCYNGNQFHSEYYKCKVPTIDNQGRHKPVPYIRDRFETLAERLEEYVELPNEEE